MQAWVCISVGNVWLYVSIHSSGVSPKARSIACSALDETLGTRSVDYPVKTSEDGHSTWFSQIKKRLNVKLDASKQCVVPSVLLKEHSPCTWVDKRPVQSCGFTTIADDLCINAFLNLFTMRTATHGPPVGVEWLFCDSLHRYQCKQLEIPSGRLLTSPLATHKHANCSQNRTHLRRVFSC